MYSQQSSLASKCFASYFWQNERPTNQQLANPKFNFTVVEGCTSGGHSETFCHGTSYDSWTGPSCEDDCEFTSRSLLEPRSASWRSWQVIGNEGLPIFSNKIKGIYKPLCLQQQKWHLWLNLSFFFLSSREMLFLRSQRQIGDGSVSIWVLHIGAGCGEKSAGPWELRASLVALAHGILCSIWQQMNRSRNRQILVQNLGLIKVDRDGDWEVSCVESRLESEVDSWV